MKKIEELRLEQSDRSDVDIFESLETEIQNLIWALGFEKYSLPKTYYNHSHSWQTIEVKEGPKNDTMYAILNCAKRAISEREPMALKTAMITYKGHDLVKNWLGQVVSLSENNFAITVDFIGSFHNQPGHLVTVLLKKACEQLKQYEVVEKYLPFMLFAKKAGIPPDVSSLIAKQISVVECDAVNKHLFWKHPTLTPIASFRPECHQIKCD